MVDLRKQVTLALMNYKADPRMTEQVSSQSSTHNFSLL